MAFEILKEKNIGKILEVTIGATPEHGGTRSHTVTIGGSNVLPYHFFEGTYPHSPVVAMEVFDKVPPKYPQSLLNYFGEDADRCGICDVCRDRNELDLSKYEFDLILEDIKSVLEQNNPDTAELAGMINHPEEKVIKVIRWLLDHKKVSPDKDHRLTWIPDSR